MVHKQQIKLKASAFASNCTAVGPTIPVAKMGLSAQSYHQLNSLVRIRLGNILVTLISLYLQIAGNCQKQVLPIYEFLCYTDQY